MTKVTRNSTKVSTLLYSTDKKGLSFLSVIIQATRTRPYLTHTWYQYRRGEIYWPYLWYLLLVVYHLQRGFFSTISMQGSVTSRSSLNLNQSIKIPGHLGDWPGDELLELLNLSSQLTFYCSIECLHSHFLTLWVPRGEGISHF